MQEELRVQNHRMTVQVAFQAAFQAAVPFPVLRWMMKQQCHGTEMDVSGLGEGRILQKAITEVDSSGRVIRACLRHDTRQRPNAHG